MSIREVVVVFKTPDTVGVHNVDALVRRDAIQSLLKHFNVTLTPLFDLSAQGQIASPTVRDVRRFQELIAEQQRYYVGRVEETRADALVAELLSRKEVEAAYWKPPVENPLGPSDAVTVSAALAPQIPDFSSRQSYLDAVPAGVDARYAWAIKGGKGKDVHVIDIEGDWQFSHIDLRHSQGGIVGGTPYNDVAWRNHGTAVLGEIAGDDNAIGVVGIAPESQVAAISHGRIGSARAIQLAAQKLRAADIILLEMHSAGPRYNFKPRPDQKGYIAVEWWPDNLLAIEYATLMGIHVVEAAGNGAEDLDDGLYDKPGPNFPRTWSNPFRRTAQDSGAIIVGAGAPPSGNYGPDRSRLGFSNFGGCVDCQGWGREVLTTGYGDLYHLPSDPENEDYWYTASFSGTSSASPIVTGVVACVVGAYKEAGRSISPSDMRRMLRETGSSQQGNSTERIGTRPNLRELLRGTGN